jgi:hypothetical protein
LVVVRCFWALGDVAHPGWTVGDGQGRYATDNGGADRTDDTFSVGGGCCDEQEGCKAQGRFHAGLLSAGDFPAPTCILRLAAGRGLGARRLYWGVP